MPTIRGLPLTSLLKLAYPRRRPRERPLHVLICVADHYEPLRGGASLRVRRSLVSSVLIGCGTRRGAAQA